MLPFRTLLILALTTGNIFADNCRGFENKKDQELCVGMRDKNISMEYINGFLNQNKSSARDEGTLKAVSPKEIKTHRKKEKKANNNLLKHLDFASKHLQEYKEVYDYVEKTYGVDREVIAGILLKETIIGKYKPKHDAYITLNTVYQETEPDTKRNKWLHRLSKNNLIHLANHCFKQHIKPENCSMPSSYIGAIGIPQFMPMNLHLAKSFKGKSPDLTNLEDAIVSVGNYFNKRARYKETIDWGEIPNVKDVEMSWYDYEFEHKDSTFGTRKKGRNCYSCSNDELSYMNGYIQKIMRYNNSSNYAVGVFRMAWELHNKRNDL